nr:probable multidrug resistance-associated protein lethal(2)03659 isoform X1 [Leptinotarsa decemlineata]XP_023014260.1 probable multidrug resistance-associated protein lethal(2)03659 isoform X1 [Leptinotarsa decemlineata]XP_023014262.1 probable multidrug resistance-associated protein lethal(2)03659 isoform X1 [Leptinotarsa decemlineata]
MDDSNSSDFKNKKVHPQLESSHLNNIFFGWGLRILYKGWNKDLDEDDLYQPFEEHESHILGDQLEEIWKEEKLNKSNPSLARALWKMFRRRILWHAFWTFVLEFVLKLSQPIFVGKLMTFYEPNQKTVSPNEAYLYASLIVFTSLMYVLICHTFYLDVQHLGMKMRIACCSLIYRKTLKLSKKALGKTTIGQMINLLSNDVNRFDTWFKNFHFLWAAPIEALVIMFMLFHETGLNGLTGFSVFLVFIPLQMLLGKLTTIFRQKTAVKTDERVRLMSEIISGIQVIKMYTWERPFSKLVEEVRKAEIDQMQLAAYIKAFHMSFNKFITRLSVFLCIVSYTFTGHRVNAKFVYVISSFYNILKSSISTDFPQGVSQMAEALVTLNRIEQFLLFEEVHPKDFKISSKSAKKIYTSTPLIHGSCKKTVGIYLQDVCAKWSSNDDNTIKDINFNVGPKQLVAVVGAVGSGKSSLLHTIMKELPLTKGKKDVVGKISYASQEPWLFAGSIKQNILFGEEWDLRKYEKVIKVCALERDFSILPYGDRSIVGDRGITLSGGQRARVNLARAVYKSADIYILDDPLSAVDTKVGKQLFEDCICGYLKSKCTILVTHQLQYLKNVSKIYVMENGTFATFGTYEEIRKSSMEFAKLFKHHIDDEEIDDTIDEQASEETCLKEQDEPMELKEFRNTGDFSCRVYAAYFKAGGGYCSFIFVFLLIVLTQIVSSGSDYFVKYWVNLEQNVFQKEYKNNTFFESYLDDVVMEGQFDIIHNNPLDNKAVEGFYTTYNCIYIYSAIISLVIVLTICRSISFFRMCMKASIRLHNNMFAKVCNATMFFFNTNPSGRILNRFSKDMGCIDEVVPLCLIDTMQIALNVIAVNIVIATVNPWILVPTLVMVLIFYLFKVIYVSSSRNVKRMEATTRSPVFSHIHASLQGLPTIRAFGAQQILRKEFDRHQDLHSTAYYMFLCCNGTFGFWLDLLCVGYISLVTLSFFFMGNETYGGNVGLAITQAMSLTGMFQWGMRQWSELDNSMTSVERVVEYTELKQESTEEKKNPPITWPEHGNLDFQSVYLRYATNEPYVLNNLSFKIKPRENVGIVGRTGAGKSSLISALFQLVEIEGKVLIDGICTSDIPLKCLRSKIAIIPQEPVLFTGTVRSNLDPLNEYTDFQLWSVLEEVELKGMVSDMQLGLESKIGEGGSNLSVGQRQLVCLARANLRNNKILVLDEATANVDPKTDSLIQSTIKKKFADCTVLTVAHRLHTVMDSDKVLVIDGGSAVEFDHPHLLLKNPEGIFYGLVRETGKAMADHLIEIAEKNFKSTHK